MSDDLHLDNTYILDVESAAEMARLIALDRFTTQAMGGPFAGITDLSSLHTVLDLACGPGGWVLDVAFARPDIEVAGIDVSRTMTDYARARAFTQHLPNASFGVMSITNPLDFSDASFDLVNARFLTGVLLKEAWAPLLAECMRILRPGGYLRLTESNDAGCATSPAFERFSSLLIQAMHLLGYGFSPDGHNLGITPMLPRLLQNAGCQNIRLLAHVLDVSAGADASADFYHNFEIAYQLSQSVPCKVGLATPEEMEHLYQQLLVEMRMPDFSGTWQFMSVIGQKPFDEQPPE